MCVLPLLFLSSSLFIAATASPLESVIDAEWTRWQVQVLAGADTETKIKLHWDFYPRTVVDAVIALCRQHYRSCEFDLAADRNREVWKRYETLAADMRKQCAGYESVQHKTQVECKQYLKSLWWWDQDYGKYAHEVRHEPCVFPPSWPECDGRHYMGPPMAGPDDTTDFVVVTTTTK